MADHNAQIKSHQGIFPKFSGRSKEDPELGKDETQAWSLWVQQVEAILTVRGVKDEIMDDVTDKWNARTDEQKRTTSALYESLLKDLRPPALTRALASRFKDLRGAFTELKRRFGAKTGSARSILIGEFMDDEPHSDEDFTTFCDRKRTLLEQDLGGEITEAELLKSAVLRNLGPEFKDRVVTLMADEDKTLSECETELRELEVQFKNAEKEEDKANIKIANAASKSSNSSDSSRPATVQDLNKAMKKAQSDAYAQFVSKGKGKGGKKWQNQNNNRNNNGWFGGSNNGNWGGNDWNKFQKVKKEKGFCAFCEIWGHKVSECRKKKAHEEKKKKDKKN